MKTDFETIGDELEHVRGGIDTTKLKEYAAPLMTAVPGMQAEGVKNLNKGAAVNGGIAALGGLVGGPEGAAAAGLAGYYGTLAQRDMPA
jgi:hypothetical protein